MNSFFNKKNEDVINKRIKITYDKIRLNKQTEEVFSFFDDNLESYVRIMYLLGEPCWGKCSPVNNHSSYSMSYYFVKSH
jgi:hypothetical protein